MLADFIEVDASWERAAEEFLHDELEYIVVKDWTHAEQGMTLLRGELEGRATFLVEGGSAAGESATPSAPDLPRLSDQIKFTNGLSGQTRNLLPRLAGCYLANDRDQARGMADAYPDSHFLLSDGQCYNGRMLTGGRKKASGPLVLKREMREFASQLKAQEQALAERIASQETLQRETTALEAELERLRQLQQSSEKESVSLDHELRRASEEINRANSRISVARLELERLESRRRARA